MDQDAPGRRRQRLPRRGPVPARASTRCCPGASCAAREWDAMWADLRRADAGRVARAASTPCAPDHTPRGHGSAAARGRSRRRGLRLPPRRRACLRLRHRGAHRSSSRAQPVLVPDLPARTGRPAGLSAARRPRLAHERRASCRPRPDRASRRGSPTRHRSPGRTVRADHAVAFDEIGPAATGRRPVSTSRRSARDRPRTRAADLVQPRLAPTTTPVIHGEVNARSRGRATRPSASRPRSRMRSRRERRTAPAVDASRYAGSGGAGRRAG